MTELPANLVPLGPMKKIPLLGAANCEVPPKEESVEESHKKEDVRMLEEKDLESIRAIVKEEVAEARQEAMQGASVLMESHFQPQFNLLAEGQQTILEKLDRLEDMEVMDTRISALEAMVKKLNREVSRLQRAQ